MTTTGRAAEQMEELGEEDALDPNPDIHALFCYYNSLYFGDSLGACSVSWSSSRMTRCAGVCHYQQRGGCKIRLSEPLLKFRPTADLKNTLLHEMIHAFLWIENRNKDHSDHGPNFQRIMNGINCSSLEDHQRPAGGYHITVYHDFHAEVDSYQGHQWMCESCGDLIKRAMNRAPSASDCIKKVKLHGYCGHRSCHWHQHKMACSGSYTKIAEPPGYEGKGSKGRRKHDNDGDKELSLASGKKAAKAHKAVDSKDKSGAKKVKTITNFFPVVDTENLDVDNSSSNGDSQKHLCHDNSKAVVLKLPNVPVNEQIFRRVRSHPSRGKRKFADVAHESKYTVMSRWLDWYAEEGEGYKDIEPLINKRTERRKKQRMLVNSQRKVIEDETMADTPMDVDIEVTKTIDPVASPSKYLIDDRGVSQPKLSGCCGGMDSSHDVTQDDAALSFSQSGKVNVLEISDD